MIHSKQQDRGSSEHMHFLSLYSGPCVIGPLATARYVTKFRVKGWRNQLLCEGMCVEEGGVSEPGASLPSSVPAAQRKTWSQTEWG